MSSADQQNKVQPPDFAAERRKWHRTLPKPGTSVTVDTPHGKANAVVVDDSICGGAGLIFKSDPSFEVGTKITVVYRRSPAKAEIRYVLQKNDEYRVGVRWLAF